MFRTGLLDSTRLDVATAIVRRAPFPFMVAHELLPKQVRADLNRDFPSFSDIGFVPYSEAECGRSLNQLVSDLTTREFVCAVGRKLGIPNLHVYPMLIEIRRRRDDPRAETHVRSASKVATALLHLDDGCPYSSQGCLRFLSNVRDIDSAISPEVKPAYGEFAAFAHTADSRHGVLPYRGERRVIQISWLTTREAKRRKTQGGAAAQLFERIMGRRA